MSSSKWDLAQAETQRALQRHREEDEEALRLARRASRWRGVLQGEQSFTERSRRQRPGAVKTQETYVRDDVHCGVDACARCESLPHVRVFRPPRRLTRDHAEYVVPDAVALLQLMELLEEPSFGATVRDVLVLETVLHEALRIAPSRDATRLKNFLKDESRRMVEACCVVFFPNQHHVDTAVERAVEGATASRLEPLASRDARALVKTLAWYTTHHIAPTSRLVVWTPEPGSALSRELRETLHVEATTCEAYLQAKFKHPRFLVELAENTREAVRWWSDQQTSQTAVTGEFFAPHLPRAQLRDGVANGTLIQGRLEVSAHNPNEAFVVVDKRLSARAGLAKVFICGKEHMNRGVHGDDVVVELLPASEWAAPQSDRVLVHYSTEESGAVDRPEKKDERRDAAMATAAVVGIAQRSAQCVVATVLSSSVSPGEDIALAIPMDRRLPKVRLRSQRMDALLDKRLKIRIDHWPLDSMYPSGHYTAVLGDYGSLPAELSAILVTHDIEDAPFCEAALACLPAACEQLDIDTYKLHECSTAKRAEAPPLPLLEWQVPQDEIATRRDLRTTHRVFSVDPPGCQDIDDAMSVRRLPNGNLELGVHIADVSFFVAHASPLDFEGRRRATTVYLVGQRLDMLPAVLSADLCSLHEHVDRVAMSVLWELDAKTLEVLDDRTWYGRTVINSCASMTYDQAHRILHGLNADTGHGKQPATRRGVAGGPVPLPLQRELEGDLRLLTAISRKLAKARGEEGGLDLSRSETFSLNVSELTGGDVELVMKESLEIHGTIAELMILANGYVAKKIVTAFPSNALLRRHPPPSGPRFEQLIRMAEAKDITIDASNNYTLQQSLVDAERSGKADAKTMALLKSLAVRVMSEAEYVCASAAEASTSQAQNHDTTSYAHYGLGLQYYTHFTSPIRRYADIVVHRQLLAALALDARGQSRQILTGASKRDPATARGTGKLPRSLVPSVLEKDEEDELDALVADVDSRLQLASDDDDDDGDTSLLFPPSELVPLSQHLNRKNRHAKQASRSCEELFLALYFSTHTIRTVAIVTALKQNGFLVYVPTYDLRAPVYVRDRDGAVQMDPLLCGVRIVDSLPATGAFASASWIRVLPQASIELDADADKLHVLVASARVCTFAILDEIEVEISCDLSGSNARVPQLQLQLVGRALPTQRRATPRVTTTPSPLKTPSRDKTSIPELQRIVQKRSAAEAAARQASPRPTGGATRGSVASPHRSMYELLLPENRSQMVSPPRKKKTLLTATAKPAKEDEKVQAKPKVRRVGAGRLVFGDYARATTQHYQQKLASYMDQRSDDVEDALTIQRHGGSGLASAQELKQMERDALTRTAKLASEKRHDRVNARRKAGH